MHNSLIDNPDFSVVNPVIFEKKLTFTILYDHTNKEMLSPTGRTRRAANELWNRLQSLVTKVVNEQTGEVISSLTIRNINKEKLANNLHLSLRSINRYLAKFEEMGKIKCKYKIFQIKGIPIKKLETIYILDENYHLRKRPSNAALQDIPSGQKCLTLMNTYKNIDNIYRENLQKNFEEERKSIEHQTPSLPKFTQEQQEEELAIPCEDTLSAEIGTTEVKLKELLTNVLSKVAPSLDKTSINKVPEDVLQRKNTAHTEDPSSNTQNPLKTSKKAFNDVSTGKLPKKVFSTEKWRKNPISAKDLNLGPPTPEVVREICQRWGYTIENQSGVEKAIANYIAHTTKLFYNENHFWRQVIKDVGAKWKWHSLPSWHDYTFTEEDAEELRKKTDRDFDLAFLNGLKDWLSNKYPHYKFRIKEHLMTYMKKAVRYEKRLKADMSNDAFRPKYDIALDLSPSRTKTVDIEAIIATIDQTTTWGKIRVDLINTYGKLQNGGGVDKAWLSKCNALIDEEKRTIILKAPTLFIRDYIYDNFLHKIEECCAAEGYTLEALEAA